MAACVGTDALLAEILSELRLMRQAIEGATFAGTPAAGSGDVERHGRLLAAIEDALAGLDLPFDGQEVIEAARTHHDLDEALTTCRATTPGAVGLLFRSLRDRSIDGRRIVRDGRAWRLERTSCR